MDYMDIDTLHCAVQGKCDYCQNIIYNNVYYYMEKQENICRQFCHKYCLIYYILYYNSMVLG